MADTQRLQDHFYIKLNGALNDGLMNDMLEVMVDSSLHMPDMATVTVHDTGLKWIDDALVVPGTTLAIEAKSETGSSPLFDGEIVEVEPDFRTGDQRVVIRAFDKMHRLTRGTFVRAFVQMTDSDIISKVASEAGLSAQVESTSKVHDHVLQANESNLSFLRRRAAMLGYVLHFSDGKLKCKPPAADAGEVEVKWGETLMEFRPRLSTADMVSKDKVRGWNWKDKQSVTGESSANDGVPEIGSKTARALTDSAFGQVTSMTTDEAVHDQGAADALAKAVSHRRSTTGMDVEGTSKGNPAILAGCKLKLSNVGTRFSGTYVVTSARHVFDRSQQGYTTEFTISGHRATGVMAELRSASVDRPVLTMLPAIVTDIADPDNLGRAKVKFPTLSDDQESFWVRVMSPGAGKERGIVWLPEIDDEVLVGFINGDAQSPVILGGLWNGKDKVPRLSEVVEGGKVKRRILFSRTEHFIELDDSDGAGGIVIQDRKGNLIKLTSSDDKLTIKTTGNIEIRSSADIELKAGGNISLEASMEMELKASMGITIDGGAKVDVKGGMVNVN